MHSRDDVSGVIWIDLHLTTYCVDFSISLAPLSLTHTQHTHTHNTTATLDALIEEWTELTVAREAVFRGNFEREANLAHSEHMLALRDSLEIACDKVMHV